MRIFAARSFGRYSCPALAAIGIPDRPAAEARAWEEAEVDGHQLRCFLATAELGSVTRAAGRLDVAQPTLSQILLRLEDELGIKLFERTVRGVHLTDPGRVFQEHARI